MEISQLFALQFIWHTFASASFIRFENSYSKFSVYKILLFIFHLDAPNGDLKQ